MATALALIEDFKTWLLIALIGMMGWFSARLIEQNDQLINTVNEIKLNQEASQKDIDYMKENVSDLKENYKLLNQKVETLQSK